MKTKPQITHEQAVELETRTIANVIEKISSGAVPTARELAMLKQATAEPPAPEFKLRSASNSELARHYQVSVSTIKSWLKRHGSAVVRDPQKLQHALDGQRSGKEIEPATPLGRARLKKLNLESERIAFENSIRRGEYRRVDEAGAELRAWLERLYNELQLAVHCEFPAWAGLTAAEIESRGVAWQRAMTERLNDSAREWTPPAAPVEHKPQ